MLVLQQAGRNYNWTFKNKNSILNQLHFDQSKEQLVIAIKLK